MNSDELAADGFPRDVDLRVIAKLQKSIKESRTDTDESYARADGDLEILGTLKDVIDRLIAVERQLGELQSDKNYDDTRNAERRERGLT